jgi:hypothetical protein
MSNWAITKTASKETTVTTAGMVTTKKLSTPDTEKRKSRYQEMKGEFDP